MKESTTIFTCGQCKAQGTHPLSGRHGMAAQLHHLLPLQVQSNVPCQAQTGLLASAVFPTDAHQPPPAAPCPSSCPTASRWTQSAACRTCLQGARAGGMDRCGGSAAHGIGSSPIAQCLCCTCAQPGQLSAPLSRTHPHSPKLPPPTVAHGDGGQRVAGVAARLGGELKVKVAAALSDALQPGRAEEAMAWAAEQLEQRCPHQPQHRSRHIAGSQTNKAPSVCPVPPACLCQQPPPPCQPTGCTSPRPAPRSPPAARPPVRGRSAPSLLACMPPPSCRRTQQPGGKAWWWYKSSDWQVQLA